jgi:hypothetical protein
MVKIFVHCLIYYNRMPFLIYDFALHPIPSEFRDIHDENSLFFFISVLSSHLLPNPIPTPLFPFLLIFLEIKQLFQLAGYIAAGKASS